MGIKILWASTRFHGHQFHGHQIKDTLGFAGGWAFLPTAPCYSCHREQSALDTTFVQFYPTLLPIARQKDTSLQPISTVS
jgi:hypothetical protein